jgi:Cu/Ag efflux protein CusF
MNIRDKAELAILKKLKERDEVKAVLPKQNKVNGRPDL